MATLHPVTPSVTAPPRRWPLFLVGAALFLLGPAIYVVRFFLLKYLETPWEVPPLASIIILALNELEHTRKCVDSLRIRDRTSSRLPRWFTRC